MCADIVIVGGGPIGCWTAIQIKKRNPELDVQIYERFEEYQRKHVLRLKKISLLLYSKLCRDPREREFFKQITGMRGLSDLFMSAVMGKKVFVKTLDFEAALKSYCSDLGVKTTLRKIQSAAEVMALHPECQNFVGADGAHSGMRNEVLGEDSVWSTPLQFSIDVKYNALGEKVRQVRGYTENLQTVSVTDSITVEGVGRKEKSGLTPVTIRFLVDEKTYNATPSATFKEPLRVEDPRVPKHLFREVQSYLRYRKEEKFEDAIASPVTLTKIMLSAYTAKKYGATHTSGGRKAGWFFVGDAAQGVPYFRSVNGGLILASQLGLILAQKMSPKAKVHAYNFVRPFNLGWEFTRAFAMNAFVKTYQATRPLFRYVPHKKPKTVMAHKAPASAL